MYYMVISEKRTRRHGERIKTTKMNIEAGKYKRWFQTIDCWMEHVPTRFITGTHISVRFAPRLNCYWVSGDHWAMIETFLEAKEKNWTPRWGDKGEFTEPPTERKYDFVVSNSYINDVPITRVECQETMKDFMRNMRLEIGLPSSVMGERMGINPVSYRRYECGDRSMKLHIISQAAKALNMRLRIEAVHSDKSALEAERIKEFVGDTAYLMYKRKYIDPKKK